MRSIHNLGWCINTAGSFGIAGTFDFLRRRSAPRYGCSSRGELAMEGERHEYINVIRHVCRPSLYSGFLCDG
jgi:hypothetical protein